MDGGLNRLRSFLKSGNYAGVSIGYRLSNEAKWPAQIHDCKAAIRWVKANAVKHGMDGSKIAVHGTSAGGHLVAMLGTSAGVPSGVRRALRRSPRPRRRQSPSRRPRSTARALPKPRPHQKFVEKKYRKIGKDPCHAPR